MSAGSSFLRSLPHILASCSPLRCSCNLLLLLLPLLGCRIVCIYLATQLQLQLQLQLLRLRSILPCYGPTARRLTFS